MSGPTSVQHATVTLLLNDFEILTQKRLELEVQKATNEMRETAEGMQHVVTKGLKEIESLVGKRFDSLSQRIDSVSDRMDFLEREVLSLTTKVNCHTHQVDEPTQYPSGLSERISTSKPQFHGHDMIKKVEQITSQAIPSSSSLSRTTGSVPLVNVSNITGLLTLQKRTSS